MYRTDKQFMKDPTTAHSRIYIGNIAESVVADNLEQKFRTHGKILGLVLQRGFGFIQYENEHQARQAIESEHGCMFYGKKLNVKQAYAQSPNQNAASKQFPYQQPNNQTTNFQHPVHNMEKLRETEREGNRPGSLYEQHHAQNIGPQQQNQMQHQPQHQSLTSPQRSQPPLSHTAHHQQQQQLPQQQFPSSQQKGHHSQQRNIQQQHLSNEIPTQDTQEPPLGLDDGGPQSGSGGESMVSSGAPISTHSPSISGGPGGPPIVGGGNVSDNKRGKKRRRGGGRERERELDRYGLPLDYR